MVPVAERLRLPHYASKRQGRFRPNHVVSQMGRTLLGS